MIEGSRHSYVKFIFDVNIVERIKQNKNNSLWTNLFVQLLVIII